MCYRYRQEAVLGVTEYQDKGYYFTDEKLSDKPLLVNYKWNMKAEGLMPDNTQRYLRKIIEFCQEREINITFFVVPMYEAQILGTLDYDGYFRQISTIASEYGVPLYDFNMCKTEYLDIMHREYFMNMGHLNKEGADLFTPFLWNVLSGDPEKNKKYFCSTYAEKISLDAPETYGVLFIADENNVRHYTVASNREEGLEYHITLRLADGQQQIIQEFSENKEFVLPGDLSGTMVIITRVVDDPEKTQELEFSF